MKKDDLNIVSDSLSDTIDTADIDLDLKENNFLKVGDWFYGITGEGGFGQIVKVCHQFYEEYSRIPIGKKVGDYDKTLFIIKYFCSFDFNPRRNGTTCLLKDLDSKPYSEGSEEWKGIQKCIKENPEKYLAYQKYKVKNVESWKYVGYMAGPRFSSPEHTKEYFQELFVKIRSDLPDLFTFDELMEVAKKHECPIKFDEPEFRLIPTFELYLYYNVGESRSKRILFHAIRISFNGNFYR